MWTAPTRWVLHLVGIRRSYPAGASLAYLPPEQLRQSLRGLGPELRCAKEGAEFGTGTQLAFNALAYIIKMGQWGIKNPREFPPLKAEHHAHGYEAFLLRF